MVKALRTFSLFVLLASLAAAAAASETAAAPASEAAPAARAPGSVLLIAGQSREEFRDYVRDVAGGGAACPLPGGASFYTALTLSGFGSPHANEPGDHHQDMDYLRLQPWPLVMQVGLWLSREQLPLIAEGRFDGAVAGLRRELEALRRPVLLRIGYEFDGPHNRYPPADFVAAYRAIARGLRGSPDIFLVWHSFAMLPTYQEHPVEDWYPGDDYVDWIGISFFQPGEDGYHRAPNRDAVLALARARGKPVVVAEASYVRYNRRHRALDGEGWWEHWFRPLFAMVDAHPEIKALAIIHVDWDSQRQHAFLEWGDSRLDRDPLILRRWREEAASPRWLPADAGLYDAVRALSPRNPAKPAP